MLIEDGQGSGRTVGITSEHRIKSECITLSMPEHTNILEGNTYTLFSPITPDGANPSAGIESPCFFYFKNTNNINMIITQIRVWAESNEYLDIYFGQEGTPVNGNTATPTNMNLSSGKIADGTFLGGTRITGMSGGIHFDRLRIPADDQDHTYSWKPGIVIPKNNIITIYAGNGGIATEASITFYYHEED